MSGLRVSAKRVAEAMVRYEIKKGISPAGDVRARKLLAQAEENFRTLALKVGASEKEREEALAEALGEVVVLTLNTYFTNWRRSSPALKLDIARSLIDLLPRGSRIEFDSFEDLSAIIDERVRDCRLW
jgi:hypothetical protein